MAQLGSYCKAYLVRDLQQFAGWQPNLKNLRPASEVVDGQEIERPRTTLADDDVLYVQENGIVTDGIFLDAHVVVDEVTPEWQTFCRDVLQFQVPDDAGPIAQLLGDGIPQA